MSEHDPDEVVMAERAVVGSCIFAPSIVRDVVPIVAPSDFGDTRLGALYGLILGMVSANGPEAVTPVTVVSEARRRNAIPAAEVKGTRVVLPDHGAIAALVTHGIPGEVTAHARLVAEAALGRALAAFGRRTAYDVEQGANPALIAARAVEQAKAIRDRHTTSGMGTRTLSDVLADEHLNDYDWVIPGLLEAGDRLIVTGGEGLGKTTLLRTMILCAAAGVHPFNGDTYPRKTVLAIDAENSERQWHRKTRGIAVAVGRLSGIDPARHVHLACVPRRDLTNPRDLADIHAAIDEVAPDLIYIGPLYKMVPTAINNDTEAAPLINALDSIHERGVTLIMEAHAGKGLGEGGVRNYAPRGSAALLGWPEFGFGLAPDTENENCVQVVRWRGDRDERDWPKRLRRGGVLPWTDDSIDPDHEASAPARPYGIRAVD